MQTNIKLGNIWICQCPSCSQQTTHYQNKEIRGYGRSKAAHLSHCAKISQNIQSNVGSNYSFYIYILYVVLMGVVNRISHFTESTPNPIWRQYH